MYTKLNIFRLGYLNLLFLSLVIESIGRYYSTYLYKNYSILSYNYNIKCIGKDYEQLFLFYNYNIIRIAKY